MTFTLRNQTTDNPTAGPTRTGHDRPDNGKLCWYCERKIGRREPERSGPAFMCSVRCRNAWDDTKAFIKRMEKSHGGERKTLTRRKRGSITPEGMGGS